MSLYRPAKTIEIVVGTKEKEPPITAGNRVPNKVWHNVFKPATNSNVWITFAFSSWYVHRQLNYKDGVSWKYLIIKMMNWDFAHDPLDQKLNESNISSSLFGSYCPSEALHFLHPSGEQESLESELLCQASPSNVGSQVGWPQLH